MDPAADPTQLAHLAALPRAQLPRPLRICPPRPDHPEPVDDRGAAGARALHPAPGARGAAPQSWLEGVLPERTPAGRAIPRGPAASTYQEILALVAAGEVICPVPDEGRRYFPWPGVAYLPLDGAPPVRWALVWRASGSSPLVRAFAAAAQPAD